MDSRPSTLRQTGATMSAHKFHVGQRVVAVKDCAHPKFKKGDNGIVKECFDNGVTFWVEFAGIGRVVVAFDEIAPLEPKPLDSQGNELKVGDWVIRPDSDCFQIKEITLDDDGAICWATFDLTKTTPPNEAPQSDDIDAIIDTIHTALSEYRTSRSNLAKVLRAAALKIGGVE
jgi:hypothetical protein